MVPTNGFDSHTLVASGDWFLFSESQALPTFVLTVRAIPAAAAVAPTNGSTTAASK
jgi:hypothetical protein